MIFFAAPNMQDDEVDHTSSETTKILETTSKGEPQEQQLQQMKEVNDQSRNGTHTLCRTSCLLYSKLKEFMKLMFTYRNLHA